MSLTLRRSQQFLLATLTIALVFSPDFALAQATSPFLTGANSLQTNIMAWLTPVAIILIMVLGGMAMANRVAWGWCIGAIIGIAISFRAPQIGPWARGVSGGCALRGSNGRLAAACAFAACPRAL